MALKGTIAVAGDKSITHRALIFSSLAKGATHIVGPLLGEDCLSTLRIFEALGVSFCQQAGELIVVSPGMEGFKREACRLDAGNSGTTARLLMGLFAGLSLEVSLTGDESLQSRPMKRVADPLGLMGANIKLKGNYLPAQIKGSPLKAIAYRLPVASAQVKSALMLAALTAKGTTVIEEPVATRDHTEKMFTAFGLAYEKEKGRLAIEGGQLPISPGMVQVPGDISSAAFFMVAAQFVPGSEIVVQNVGINPTRSGIIDALAQMGAELSVENFRYVGGEEVGDLVVRYTEKLKPFVIAGDLVPRLIDEIPILALLALRADGASHIRDAKELRVKETDRIATTVSELSAIGGHLEAHEDGISIMGNPNYELKEAAVDSHGDHRIAMMLAIASLRGEASLNIKGLDAMAVSYPNFLQDLASLGGTL